MRLGQRWSVPCTLTVVLAVTIGSPRAPAGGGAGKSVQVFNIYQSGGAALTAADAEKLARYYMFSFNRNRYYQIPPNTYDAVRAYNPDVLIFNYQQGPDTWTNQDGSPVLNVNNIVRYNNTYGHSMGNLNTDNPDLFLLDSSGERLHTYYKDYRYVLDFGSPDFQAYWLEATEHDVVDQEWAPDGIFVDNCMVTYPSYFCARPAKYPTDASWTTAMISWHAALAAGLHARDTLVWTNSDPVGDADGYAAWLAIDADPNHVDWLNSEGSYCHKWGSSDCTFYSEDRWKRQVDVMVNMQNTGAAMFSHVGMPEGGSGVDNYGRPVTYWDALWYAMGSFLLGKNEVRGNDVFYFSNSYNAYVKLYWYDEYDRIDLGPAVSTYVKTVYAGRNIYWREFEKGYVYVNPTGGDCSSIPLPEACKQLSHATINDDPAGFPDVMNIALPSHRAAMLLKTSQIEPEPSVAGRYVFYNNSAFDDNDPAANAADDGAIATDKEALLPGQGASFANYTSYSRGINGIMIDIASPAGPITASDFAFKVGNSEDPDTWATAPAPSNDIAADVRPGAGAGGSDRVTILWADNAIQNQWVQVTVKAEPNIGLLEDDVFYFGNAIGETGDSPTDAEVTPADEVGVRGHPHTLLQNPADVENAYDFNRDRKVGPTDAVICREHGSSGPSALQLIDLFENEAPQVDAGDGAEITWPTDTASLDGTVSDDGHPSPPGAVTTSWSKVSGPGDVTFGDASAVDTTVTFSTVGTYLLQLEASDGGLSASDTVTITVFPPGETLFEEDFDDDNLVGWTTLQGSFDTFRFLSEPGYELHATTRDSRMRAELTNDNLGDIVHLTFKIRHTHGAPPGGGGSGWKWGRVFLVDDTGSGLGIAFALDRTSPGELELLTTPDDGASESAVGAYSAPGNPGGYELKRVELIYDRVNDTVECIYEGASKGALSVSGSYRDFTRVLVRLNNHWDGDWGQIDIDDIRVANISSMP